MTITKKEVEEMNEIFLKKEEERARLKAEEIHRFQNFLKTMNERRKIKDTKGSVSSTEGS